VTLFGIFLTPVFFYVIQGLGEMRLLESAVLRRVGSALMGGLSGFAVGFLLARITHLRSVWEVAIGVSAAVLGALLVLALSRMVSRRAAVGQAFQLDAGETSQAGKPDLQRRATP
jgi:multidrug efflux pump